MSTKDFKKFEELNENDQFDCIFDQMGFDIDTSIDLGSDANDSDKSIKEKANPIGTHMYLLDAGDRKAAVEAGLVPLKYMNCAFSKDTINDNLAKLGVLNNYGIKNFEKYIEVTYGILSSIRLGHKPKKSRLIGAPNNFGKASLANECIMLMAARGWKTVPYVSLMEIGEAMTAASKAILIPTREKPIDVKNNKGVASNEEISNMDAPLSYIKYNEVTDFIKTPSSAALRYSWREFCTAECLFCYMSSIENREAESRVLYALLNTRASKGLPTIVMIQFSFNMYINNNTIGKFIWNDIYTRDENIPDYIYDVLVHTSCYKESKGVNGRS